MSFTVTALYDVREDAARALKALRAEVSLSHADIYDPTDAGIQALQSADLTPEERTACEGKLATGEYLLLAQPCSGNSPDSLIAVLERVAAEPVDEPPSVPPQRRPAQAETAHGSSPRSESRWWWRSCR